jgi:hypothetical protein
MECVIWDYIELDSDDPYSLELLRNDLANEIRQIWDRGERCELISCRVYAPSAEQPCAEGMLLLWAPGAQRAGFYWGGEPAWTDAQSVDDAIRRFNEDDLNP